MVGLADDVVIIARAISLFAKPGSAEFIAAFLIDLLPFKFVFRVDLAPAARCYG